MNLTIGKESYYGQWPLATIDGSPSLGLIDQTVKFLIFHSKLVVLLPNFSSDIPTWFSWLKHEISFWFLAQGLTFRLLIRIDSVNSYSTIHDIERTLETWFYHWLLPHYKSNFYNEKPWFAVDLYLSSGHVSVLESQLTFAKITYFPKMFYRTFDSSANKITNHERSACSDILKSKNDALSGLF